MKTEIKKQLKVASNAIDLIKISQRTQHTSIKEALKKSLRCISIIADEGDGDGITIKKITTAELLEATQEIKKAQKRGDKNAQSDTKNKTRS